MTYLLDANVLVALVQPEHVHHGPAAGWFTRHEGHWATTPTTQGALLRLLLVLGASIADARETLREVIAHERHEFWPDHLSYGDVRLDGVVGHRQVTDAYLAAQARSRGGRLLTLDRGLVALHRDVAELLVEPR